MQVDKKLLAPCGLYCGVCGIRVAHAEGNQRLKEKLGMAYGCTPEEIACSGCKSEERFKFCKTCPIRECAESKGLESCARCTDFPCTFITNFPIPAGKKVMLRAIPEWREKGTEQWVRGEEERYRCPACGEKLFRGAKRCGKCKEPVTPD